MNKLARSLIIISSIVFMYGCSEEDMGTANCDSQINDLISRIGQPEEINRYDSSGYHSHSYWYWCRGFEKDFTWGDNVTNCEMSTYTFSPICY